MKVRSQSPVPLNFVRDGGSIVTGRIDIWAANQNGWDMKASNVFQQVTKNEEHQSATLAPGTYTVVFTCRAEESINGMYGLKMDVNGVTVADKQGNVDSTVKPNESIAYKNQFMLEVVSK